MPTCAMERVSIAPDLLRSELQIEKISAGRASAGAALRVAPVTFPGALLTCQNTLP